MPGDVTMETGGAHITVPGDTSPKNITGYAGIDYNPPKGIVFKDLTGMTVTWKGGPTVQQFPFVDLLLGTPTGAPLDESVSFRPIDQAGGRAAFTPDRFQTWNVFAPAAKVVAPVHLGQPGAKLQTIEEALAADGDGTLAKIQIQAGCTTAAATATVSSVQLQLGSEVLNFRFKG